ncbi:MAG: AAA family ATPase [Rhodothermales bacterium]|nr:AAA family ATPase [Rhodothermales bacterium]
MDDLFEASSPRRRNAPLADRMRPRTLDDYVGQEHILGPGTLLRRAIEADRIKSLLLYGPPGTGKTTLARIIANTTRARFLSLNAVLAGVKDIRSAITTAEDALRYHHQRTILFVDEVHRFNKAQQDALLPHVENGTVTLIGATTENPYFEVIKALVSRSRVFELRSLDDVDLENILRMTLEDADRGYGDRKVRMDEDAAAHLVSTANGDARSLLNALELAIETTPPGDDGAIHVTLSVAEESIQQRAVLYDKEGDAHYDTISAFIKSLRGSDPDASLYWMARMVYAGEDPRFIFRRMLIFASEDIGLADPNALRVAMSCQQAFDVVGMPEGRFHLAQCCLYLATAPKSNTTLSFFQALSFVEKERSGEVPNPLKDGSRDGEGLGHGKGYQYPHAFHNHYTPQQYLPDQMQGTYFYDPSEVGYERRIRERMDYWRSRDAAESLEKRVQHYGRKEDPDSGSAR